MADMEKYELEFVIKSSTAILFNCVSTPSGLSEWFSDDVNIKKDLFIFIWDGAEEEARLLNKKNRDYIRFKWVEHEEEDLDTYFEFRLRVNPTTKEVALMVTDFAEPDELEEAKLLWESQVGKLKQILGG